MIFPFFFDRKKAKGQSYPQLSCEERACPDGRLILRAVPMWSIPLFRRFPRLLVCLGLRKKPRKKISNIIITHFFKKIKRIRKITYKNFAIFPFFFLCFLTNPRRGANWLAPKAKERVFSARLMATTAMFAQTRNADRLPARASAQKTNLYSLDNCVKIIYNVNCKNTSF